MNPAAPHVYVVNTYPSYSETFIADEISELERRGIRVYVYALKPGACAHPASDEFSGQYVAQPVRLWRMFPYLPEALRIVAIARPATSVGWAALARILYSALHAARLSRSVRRTWRRGESVVLRSHFLGRPTDVAALAHGVLHDRSTLIATSHAGDSKDRRNARMARWRMTRLDGLICASDYVATNVRDIAPPALPRIVLRCGVRLATYAPSACSSIMMRPVEIVTVARLVSTKGLDYAVSVVKGLSAERSVRWTVIGDGPYREAFVDHLADAGLTDVANLEGAKSHHDVLSRFNSADLFLLTPTPNVANGGDGIPVAILEAMAAGVLVCSRDSGGIGEVVRDLETGILASAHEAPGQVARRVATVLSDTAATHQIVAAAHRIVSTHCDMSANAKRLLDFCEVCARANG